MAYDPPPMAVRVLLIAAAIALVALGLGRRDAHDACDSGRREAFAIGARRAPATDAPGAVRTLIDRCRGAEQIVDGASALLHANAVDAAGALARAAVRREPQRRDSWLALAAVRRRSGDAAGARRASDRARQLDPLSFAR